MYWLSEKYENKGMITKTVKLITKYGFERLNINYKDLARVFIFYQVSKRILEKSGYKEKGGQKRSQKKIADSLRVFLVKVN